MFPSIDNAGSRTLTANYSGNATYNASSGTTSHTVTSACSNLIFADDFSTDKGWIDHSNGYVLRDAANQRLNWTSARSHPMRYYIPVSASSDCVQLKFRFNVTSASGNGGVYFGLVENLDAPSNIWGIDATGIFAGLDRDTSYGP